MDAHPRPCSAFGLRAADPSQIARKRAQGGVLTGSTSGSGMDRGRAMRGQEKKQTSMLILRSPEDFVPKQHPIRRIKKLADDVLRTLSPTLEAMYAQGDRPSIPPERLLKQRS